MGLMRMMASVGTLGLVSPRSAEARTAHYARQTRNAVRATVVQNGMDMQIQRQQLEAANYGNVQADLRPVSAPANWYPDPGNPGYLRWWDGVQWTGYTA